MSQQAQRQDGARTRASTSGTALEQPTAREDWQCEPSTPPVTSVRPLTEEAAVTTQPVTASYNSKIDRILERLEGLDQVRSELTAMNLRADRFQSKHDLDVQTAVKRDEQHAKDIGQLTELLAESRRARALEEREHMVTKRELASVRENFRRVNIQVNDMENRLRGCNVKLDGVDETDREDLVRLVLEVAAAMGLNALTKSDIDAAYRLGRIPSGNVRNQRQRPRSIMVNFHSHRVRNNFYFARTRLRNCDQFRKVYVNDDVTQLTRRQREEFKSVANLARDQGTEVRIHSDGILLGGRKFYLTEPHLLPERFSLATAKTVKVGNDVYFASEHSYLSNFHNSPIVENGTVFQSAEHMYQAYKCRAAGELNRMKRVIDAPSPLEAKTLADSVQESPEWKNGREGVMIRVVGLKFDQNPLLADKLIKTGDAGLHEATHNLYYGIGAHLHSREIKEKSYKGENRLGLILAEKRASLIAERTGGGQ